MLPVVFIAALTTTCCHLGALVDGARMDAIVVPSDRYQSLKPRTLQSLATKANLGLHNGFRVDGNNNNNGDGDVPTAKGVKLRRLVQTYGGYEVYGSVATAELTLDGQYTGHVTGDVVFDLSDDIPDPEVCHRSINDVISVALAAEGMSSDDRRVQEKDGRRVVFLKEDGSDKAVLAYVVEFFIEEKISKPVYVIDACDDTVYSTYNLIQDSWNRTTSREDGGGTGGSSYSAALEGADARAACKPCNPSVTGYGGNAKTRRTQYNKAPKCLPVYRRGNTCTMSSRYVKVVNNMGSSTRSNQRLVSFSCSSGYRDPYRYTNGAYGIANDALYFGHISGLMFTEIYKRSFNTHRPRAVVHYGSGYENAFWDGRDMYYGDGRTYFYPLAVLDVVAHEYAHGITSSNSRLEYREQSGGINEAFSDITGTVVKYYEYGRYDWYMGRDMTKRTTALRYMYSPTRDGRSINHASRFRRGMNVHYSSGVFNYAFYLMVHTYRVQMYHAYHSFLDANMSRWGRTTTFLSGACHVARSAYQNGFNHAAVVAAFNRVGLSLSKSCRLNVRSATIYSGQKRSEILVSKERNPILEISLDRGNATISVTSEDGSDVSLSLASDEGAEHVSDVKVNRLQVLSPKDDHLVYVKLTSSHRGDLKVVMQIN